ncbi:PAXX protein, partial [Chordeiles acutipennis]|nr:PAXX protein [Chordeiles acutipennis]
MAEPAGPFHLLQAGPGRYLCYCCPGPGPGPGGTVYVTDALEVWAAELGARPPLGCALGRGSAALSLGEGKATLRLPDEAPCSALDLWKLPAAEARRQLQALLFGMAGRLESLERRLAGLPKQPADLVQSLSCPSLTEADPSSRKGRGAGSAVLAKRKIPGESLINPGFKSKKAPSGVDFEDS